MCTERKSTPQFSTLFQGRSNNPSQPKLSLQLLQAELKNHPNSSFSLISDIKHLHQLIPLDTKEMHYETGNIIEKAENEICMLFYKFHPRSDAGKIFLESLMKIKEKAAINKKKIVVYMIVNARGKLAELGYKKNEIDPELERISNELNTQPYFQFNFIIHRAQSFGSLHSKYIIIDGNIAMLRGADIDENDNLENKRQESAMIVDQPLAAELREDFVKFWNSLSATHLKLQPTHNPFTESKSPNDIPCIFLSKAETGNPLSRAAAPYKIALLKAIECAQTRINIVTANINDPEIYDALAKACNRGIKVCCVMGKYHNDKTEKNWGGTNLICMGKLAGKIHRDCLQNLELRWATNEKNELVNSQKKRVVHSKYICIDGQIVFTGSSAPDKQAMYFSKESDIIFESKTKAAEFDAKFFHFKFNTGRDFFEDAYLDLQKKVMEILKKSEPTADDMLVNQLKSILVEDGITRNPDLHGFKKSVLMLAALMPTLQAASKSNQKGADAIRVAILAAAKIYGIHKEDIYLPEPMELTEVNRRTLNGRARV